MGLYQGILLTPKAPDIMPASERIVQFLEWLIPEVDLELPSAKQPVLLRTSAKLAASQISGSEFKLIAVKNKQTGRIEFNPSQSAKKAKLPAAKNWLENTLDEFARWQIQLPYSAEAVNKRIEQEATGALSQSLTFPLPELERYATLSTVSLHKMPSEDFISWWQEYSYPGRSFVIDFYSNLRAGRGDYFSEAWRNLNNSKVLAQIEQLLNTELEAFPYLG